MDIVSLSILAAYSLSVIVSAGAVSLISYGWHRQQRTGQPLLPRLRGALCRAPGNRHSPSESGNVFAMLFGGVALVGVLGATTMQFIQGPLTTAVNVNRQTAADTQMMTGAQLIMATSAGQPSDGDCDGDGTVEPLPLRTPIQVPSQMAARFRTPSA